MIYFAEGFSTSNSTYGVPNSKNMSPEELVDFLNKDKEYEFFVRDGKVLYRPYARRLMIK